MTELELQGQLVTPQGSIVDLAKPDEVAIAYDDVQQLKTMLREVEGKLKQALIEHSSAVGKKSFELAGVAKIEIKGGTETKYDPHAIKAGLKKAGCPAERINEIVRQTIEYKISAVEAKRAARANSDYAAVIEQHSIVEQKTPQVIVTRLGRELTATSSRSAPVDEDTTGGGEKLPWE